MLSLLGTFSDSYIYVCAAVQATDWGFELSIGCAYVQKLRCIYLQIAENAEQQEQLLTQLGTWKRRKNKKQNKKTT